MRSKTCITWDGIWMVAGVQYRLNYTIIGVRQVKALPGSGSAVQRGCQPWPKLAMSCRISDPAWQALRCAWGALGGWRSVGIRLFSQQQQHRTAMQQLLKAEGPLPLPPHQIL